MKPITVTYHNDEHTSTWAGFEERGILRFDFTNDGTPRRFFVMPEYCVMFADETALGGTRPRHGWFIHLVDAIQQDPERGVWLVEDREIDVIVETDLRTYRIIDLDDFGQALCEGRISLQDAQRLLTALQRFLDTYLHGGGKWPPDEIREWTTM